MWWSSMHVHVTVHPNTSTYMKVTGHIAVPMLTFYVLGYMYREDGLGVLLDGEYAVLCSNMHIMRFYPPTCAPTRFALGRVLLHHSLIIIMITTLHELIICIFLPTSSTWFYVYSYVAVYDIVFLIDMCTTHNCVKVVLLLCAMYMCAVIYVLVSHAG